MRQLFLLSARVDNKVQHSERYQLQLDGSVGETKVAGQFCILLYCQSFERLPWIDYAK